MSEEEKTAEQKARDILERMGIESAQEFSSGTLVELANLIAEIEELKYKIEQFEGVL